MRAADIEWKLRLRKDIRVATLKIAREAVNQTQIMIYRQPPAKSGYVRTGRLKASILPSIRYKKLSASISPRAHGFKQVDYAPYVHAGINQPQPRPFLEKAVDIMRPKLPKTLKVSMDKTFKNVARKT